MVEEPAIVFDTSLGEVSGLEDGVVPDVDVAAAFGAPFGATIDTMRIFQNTNEALLQADIDGAGIASFTLFENRNGVADVTFEVTTTLGLLVYDTLRVTVQAVDDPPTVAEPVADVTSLEGAEFTVDLTVVFADPDTQLDGLPLIFTALSSNPSLFDAAAGGIFELDENGVLWLKYANGAIGNGVITLTATGQCGQRDHDNVQRRNSSDLCVWHPGSECKHHRTHAKQSGHAPVPRSGVASAG